MAKKPMDMSISPKSCEDGSEDDLEAKYAFDTIMRADSHRSDPSMMRRVSKVAQRHADSAKRVVRSVADIKEYSKKKYPPKLRFEREET